MEILRKNEIGVNGILEQVDRRAIPAKGVKRTVAKIVGEVEKNGDEALVEICNHFSDVKISVDTLRVTGKAKRPTPKVREALGAALKNIERFSRQQLPKNWMRKNAEGAEVGEQFSPIRRVGVYVPGGTAPLVSTALMTVALAKIAKVPEIVVCTPAPVDPVLHYAIELAGATEIYQISGAQAIAALAYGTESIKPVLKVFGPGNSYVVEAKRQLFGIVGVDLIPGPSELAVVADGTADAAYVAADLLAQAEHGSGSQVYLVTTEEVFLDAVIKEIEKQSKKLSRKNFLEEALASGAKFILVDNLKEATVVAEGIAAEHLSLVCKGAEKMASKITQSGAVFVGNYSAVALGDYMAGPSHTLPTGGGAKSFGGLTVEQFIKRTSVVRYTKRAVEKSWPTIRTLTKLEQMTAHQASVKVRCGK